ncbi:tyrosine-type recombinase/integrase [Marinobacter sp.]|uniref:tyrosine-type recombinase/integrase n=1 Tax=Marinobacter sp. TaxID=50741 RepID=UPI003B522D0B
MNITAYRVTYNAIKSGKSSSIPLSKEIYNQVIEELPFQSCYSAFRPALERSRAEITLPKGQLTHICRHTFASHFVMNGGHILTLQKILEHSDLKLSMRYAHLVPHYLEGVISKGPCLVASA